MEEAPKGPFPHLSLQIKQVLLMFKTLQSADQHQSRGLVNGDFLAPAFTFTGTPKVATETVKNSSLPNFQTMTPWAGELPPKIMSHTKICRSDLCSVACWWELSYYQGMTGPTQGSHKESVGYTAGPQDDGCTNITTCNWGEGPIFFISIYHIRYQLRARLRGQADHYIKISYPA